MKDKLNVSIEEGPSFFSHETSINFNPTQFILDFKNVTPRMDPRFQDGPVIHIKHSAVMLELYHAKRFHELLGQALQNYEKQYGKIEKPKAIEKQEKRMKDKGAEKESVPNYFG